MKTIYLVRHAQSRYDAAIPDELRPLTATGREQASQLASVLLRFEIQEIHSSPYRRCLDTIEPFAKAAALPLNEVADLRERTFTRSLIEDWAQVWQRVWTDFDFAFSDGESSRQAQARMYEATLSLAKTSRAATLAISSHGNAIGLLLQHVDARFTFEHACAIRNPEVMRLLFDGSSLHWDADFALAELGSFATRVVTNEERLEAPRSPVP
jgi:2,3-bisphosphoglycerate-dependent phosphoglycerate mutase